MPKLCKLPMFVDDTQLCFKFRVSRKNTAGKSKNSKDLITEIMLSVLKLTKNDSVRTVRNLGVVLDSQLSFISYVKTSYASRHVMDED